MSKTLDAIRYCLDTLSVTPKELFSLIESSNGYNGEEYSRWLANEVIKIAESEDILYSQLLAKWFNIIQSIIDEYSDDAIKPCYDMKISEMIRNSLVYTIGLSDDKYGSPVDDIDWCNGVDLPFNPDFINSLPDEIKDGLLEGKGVTLFIKFNSKRTFKKSSDVVSDAKLNGVSIKSFDAMMMYRACTFVRTLDDLAYNFKFVFMTDTRFLYDSDNADVIDFFLSYFDYKGFVVNSKDLYEGSFTSEEYAFCVCTPKSYSNTGNNGFMLEKYYDYNDNIESEGILRHYSKGNNMFESLVDSCGSFEDKVPLISKDGNILGTTIGSKKAKGYLCKDIMGRDTILSNYPIEKSKYVAITNNNLLSVIAYFGVVSSMSGTGMFSDINDIIDGHSDFMTLVSNCLPIFLYDGFSLFREIGDIQNKSGKVIHLSNSFGYNSNLVRSLVEKLSVYFSFEAKELMGVCNSIVESYINGGNDIVGKTFNDIRVTVNNSELNKEYLLALLRCKEFVKTIYRGMEV